MLSHVSLEFRKMICENSTGTCLMQSGFESIRIVLLQRFLHGLRLPASP